MDDASLYPLDAMLEVDDPGGKVYQAYRYQSTYAAIRALEILIDASGVEEIFCEHHEDILLKLSTGKFHGIQVKTRDRSRLQWRARDTDVVKAFVRFRGACAGLR